MELIIKIFWFFLPAGIANMSPVIFKWVPVGGTPLDFGFKIKNQPILGFNKTIRGLVAGILSATLTVYVQKAFYPLALSWSLIDYSNINPLKLGFLLGAGALLGDAFKSFLKRRLKISPGTPWPPFDQIDWIIGAVIAANLMVKTDYKIALIAIVLFGLMHPIVNLLGYFLKIKRNKF